VNVKLHIDRLVLDGIAVEPGQRPALQAAVEAELARLLAEGGMGETWAAGGAVPALKAAGFQMNGEGPVQLGRQIAGALYGGLGK
jgi:hypothetical protein